MPVARQRVHSLGAGAVAPALSCDDPLSQVSAAAAAARAGRRLPYHLAGRHASAPQPSQHDRGPGKGRGGVSGVGSGGPYCQLQPVPVRGVAAAASRAIPPTPAGWVAGGLCHCHESGSSPRPWRQCLDFESGGAAWRVQLRAQVGEPTPDRLSGLGACCAPAAAFIGVLRPAQVLAPSRRREPKRSAAMGLRVLRS